MTRSVRFHPLATAEVVDAHRWYEQRLDGLGERFLDAVRATIVSASRWPNSGTPTRHDDSGLVLERKVGDPIRPNSVGHAFARLVETSSLARMRLPDLRHTHASHLLAAGVNAKVVSERLGHSSVGAGGGW